MNNPLEAQDRQVAKIDEARLRLRISRQSPPEREAMLTAMRKMNLSPVRMQFWIDGDEKLVPEELEALAGWVRGDWGYLSTGDGIQFIRMKKAGPAVCLGTKTGAVQAPTVAYGDATKGSTGQAGMVIARQALRGKDLPDTDAEAVKMREARRKQEEQRAKQERKPVIPLLSWGRKA